MATEEPDFDLIYKESNFEIREYIPRIIAQVKVNGNFNDASNTGFKSLADFIFGNNSVNNESEKISMTAPVIVEPKIKQITMTAPILAEEKNNQWLISFVMPKEYSFKTIPKPNNPKITLINLPKEKFAVIVFSGLVRESSYDEKIELLNDFVKKQKLKTLGSVQIARYNPPWTLPFFRRNEIMIKVQ
ncbi:MAG: heme-binding protein [Methylophilaceae bacterium]|nr:heme-binding protein [Methylophilaceae bacterium]